MSCINVFNRQLQLLLAAAVQARRVSRDGRWVKRDGKATEHAGTLQGLQDDMLLIICRSCKRKHCQECSGLLETHLHLHLGLPAAQVGCFDLDEKMNCGNDPIEVEQHLIFACSGYVYARQLSDSEAIPRLLASSLYA